jgi:ribosome biogenesis GTPase A
LKLGEIEALNLTRAIIVGCFLLFDKIMANCHTIKNQKNKQECSTMSNNVDPLEALLREEFNKLKQKDLTESVKEVKQEYEKINQQLGTLNVLVIGKAGIGKSTLLNAVFKEKLAVTGVGRPITQNTTRYYKEGCPLAIYDSKGIELPNEADQTTITRLKLDIKELITQNQDIPDTRVDLIWYCVNARNPRFEDVEE